MALKSDSQLPGNNGTVNFNEKESGGIDEDLEDGEIFDDEDDSANKDVEGSIEKESNIAPIANITEGDKSGKGKCIPNAVSDKKKPVKEKEKKGNFSEGRGEKKLDRTTRHNGPTSRRKRGRDSEDDRKSSKAKVRRNEKKATIIDEEVDENEMIYVRGGNSPLSSKPQEWDRFSDEELDRERDRENDRGGGGRGRRGREAFHSSGRVSRRARLARGGLKRRFSRKAELTLCKFFMQGKCQRGNDCPFSHNALPPKKMELCKFYMNDCCTKKDKCLYMHGDFPCKFYHSGLECYAGKRCKFYHGKISNYLRSVLNKHIETRDLQVEHEKMRELYKKKDRNFEKHSRFSDRSDRRRSPDEDEGSTPMPSPQRDHFSDREISNSPEREMSRRRRRRRDERFDDFVDHDDHYLHHDQIQDARNHDFSPKENMSDDHCNDDETRDLPVNLPKTQRELFKRIQQQQRKAESTIVEEDKRDEEFREENWYSSDEEGGGGSNPINAILNKVGVKNDEHLQPPPPIAPNMLANIDINAVSKLLSTVRETIQKKTEGESGDSCKSPPYQQNAAAKLFSTVRETMHKKPDGDSIMGTHPSGMQSMNNRSPAHQPQIEEKRSRDPRLRGMDRDDMGHHSRKPQGPLLPSPVLLTQADLDLRMSDPSPASQQADVDLRHLPFKPAPVHQAANEIDASINSRPPMDWKLRLLPQIKPDYSSVAARANTQSCVNDPRLRKYVQPQVLAQSQMVVAQSQVVVAPSMMVAQSQAMQPPLGRGVISMRTEEMLASRDPRNRELLANDPRRRSAAMQQQVQPLHPHSMPPQPPFLPHSDNDLRLGLLPHPRPALPYPPQHNTDIDLRVPAHPSHMFR